MATFSEMSDPRAHVFAHHYPGNEDHQRHLAQMFPNLLEREGYVHGHPVPQTGAAHLPHYFSPSWSNAGPVDPYVSPDFQNPDLMNGMDQFVNQQASFFREQPPTLRRQDEAENSCRPRLTPEQTASLENAFNHNPRPTTQQKKEYARHLGLTQEKVNNWFQNRRAKTKHQTKTQKSYEVLAVRPQSSDHGTPLERSDSTDSTEGRALSSQDQDSELRSDAVPERDSTLLRQHSLPQDVFVEAESFEAAGLELSRHSSNLSTQQSAPIADCIVQEPQQFWGQGGNHGCFPPQKTHLANHSQIDTYDSVLNQLVTAESLTELKHTWSPENVSESFTPANMHELEQESKKLPTAVKRAEDSGYHQRCIPAQMQTGSDHHQLSQLQRYVSGDGNVESSHTHGLSPESCSTQTSNLPDGTSLPNGFQQLDHDDYNSGMVDSWTTDFDLSRQISQPSDVFSTSQSSLVGANDIDYNTICFGLEGPSEGLHQTSLSREAGPSFGAGYSASPEDAPRRDPAFDVSRRGSITSDIANTMDNVHFASKFSSDGFQSPSIPHRPSIAARRHMHPVALNSSRTASASSNGDNTSPSIKDRLLPHHVRRIQSIGNCNAVAGRIQKPTLDTNFRSPLKMALRESKALDSLVSIVDRVGSSSFSSHRVNQPVTSSPNEVENLWQMSPPSDAEAPPLSATFTQQSLDDGSYATSPPITPFTVQPQLMGHWAEHEVPQSAPAHTTVFSAHSPPMQTQPNLNTTFHSPQPQHPINLFFDHAQGFHMRQFLQGGNRSAIHPEQQVFQRPSSSDGQITFAAKPQQDTAVPIQFSMVTYPPAPVQLPLRCNGNGNFTFQNFGVKEFEESTKLQLR